MILRVADSIVEGHTVTFSELSHGKREKSSYVPFQIYADDPGWEAKLSHLYEDLIEELKRDDEIVGEFNAPFKGALRYPSMDELMALPSEARMEFINDFLIFDILRIFISEDECADRASWIISVITDISQSEGSLTIEGFVSPFK